MKQEIITKLIKTFEDYAFNEDGVEFWFARDLQILLGYQKWENFNKVINKAKKSCDTSNNNIIDHFPDVKKKVDIGSGVTRNIDDIALTRYACYLIAQNGDPRKDEIAFAQSYFAIQTRKQELIEERINLKERLNAREKLNQSETELSKNIYERGVNEKGFARIRSKGDQSLFGGLNTKQMKLRLGLPEKRPLADFLPTVTIAAKNLATEITNLNVKNKNLQGENKISGEHSKNNKDIREVLLKNDIVPEDLPPEEDIKKLERRVKSNEKKLEQRSKKI